MVASLRSSQPAPKPSEAAAPAGRPKIADRIGAAGSASDTANAPAAAVAQKVVLYDEDPNDPQGKRYVGSALWRTETVSPGPGLAPELAIRADVEIPERRMRMTWSLRRNTDKALPASHTIEIMFTLPADFAEGGIGNVPGVLMKQNEQARGVPLAGLAVKVTNGYFLIGLSAVDSRRAAQSSSCSRSATGSTSRSSIPTASAPFWRSRKARPARAPSRKRSAPGGSRPARNHVFIGMQARLCSQGLGAA